ncbi:DUF6470 family protein [Clostridia bacterium OttesenSCG-928-F22]|nr:DUF6470 family protein [Clostridia bacterium OttesenSCG-928-F22]
MDTISIKTTKPVMEIRSEPARLHISNNRPVFRMKNVMPIMRVHRKDPKFRVMWDEVKKKAIPRSPLKYNRDYASRAEMKAMEAIGIIASQYDRLAHIENGPAASIPVVIKDRVQPEQPETNFGLIPSEKARIEWEEGEIVIEWTNGDLEIEWDMSGGPTIEVEPHVVEVRIRNHPSVKITVNRDRRKNDVGDKVDKRI